MTKWQWLKQWKNPWMKKRINIGITNLCKFKCMHTNFIFYSIKQAYFTYVKVICSYILDDGFLSYFK